MRKTIEASIKELLFLESMNLRGTEEGIKYKAKYGCDPCDACGPSSCSDCKGCADQGPSSDDYLNLKGYQ